jgi:Taurine catabolism dioxygenase TauD, TfdA family
MNVSTATAPRAPLRIRPLESIAGSDVDFGAEVAPCDLSDLPPEDFTALERALLTHHVLVVRGQKNLRPRDQYELTRRFDPSVQTYGHGDYKDLLRKSVLVQDLVSIPEVPQVQLLGHGRVQNHEGLEDAATAMAVAIGSIVHSLPPSRTTIVNGNVTYQQCGNTWYRPSYSGSSVSYTVVNPP